MSSTLRGFALLLRLIRFPALIHHVSALR